MTAPDPITTARTHFGIDGTARPLPGEYDHNTRVDTIDGRSFLLRLSPPGRDRDAMAFQDRVAINLHRGLDAIRVPVAIAAHGGATLVPLPAGWTARMFDWIPGATYAAAGRPPTLAAEIGRAAAATVIALQTMDTASAPHIERWDLLDAAAVIDGHHDHIPAPGRRSIVERVARRTTLLPLTELPRQVIHNDLNDDNLLTDGRRITGIIDLGDATATIRVAEVAIAATYAMVDQADPLTVGVEVVGHFADLVDLTNAEVASIFDLIAARLAVSVAISAARGRVNPHHQRSESGAWGLLERMMAAPTWRDRLTAAAERG